MTAGELRAVHRLARAVILRAVRDVNVPKEASSACEFLAEGAPGWAEIAGIPGRTITKWYREIRQLKESES